MSSKAKPAAATALNADSNITAKLALVIKSGKFKIGKFLFFNFLIWVKLQDIKIPLRLWDKETPNLSSSQATVQASEEPN